jgi:hypothetical protein
MPCHRGHVRRVHDVDKARPFQMIRRHHQLQSIISRATAHTNETAYLGDSIEIPNCIAIILRFRNTVAAEFRTANAMSHVTAPPLPTSHHPE